MERTEEQYLRFVRDGDQSGFDCVIEAFRENLIFFLLRYLPSLPDAEDAAEDAFVELLLHPWREDRGASLKTYLFALGRSRALNLLKKQKRRAEFHGEYLPEEDGGSAELADRLCRDETRRELMALLESLPADHREVLYFLYFEELSLAETARVMKKNRKQIENLSYRAKKALKEKLDKEAFL